MTIKGSVEILTNGGEDSAGLVLEVTDVAAIPGGLEALRSLSGFEAVDPGAYRAADAAWTAQTPDGEAAVVLWREEKPFSAMVAAEAMGLVPREPDGEDG